MRVSWLFWLLLACHTTVAQADTVARTATIGPSRNKIGDPISIEREGGVFSRKTTYRVMALYRSDLTSLLNDSQFTGILLGPNYNNRALIYDEVSLSSFALYSSAKIAKPLKIMEVDTKPSRLRVDKSFSIFLFSRVQISDVLKLADTGDGLIYLVPVLDDDAQYIRYQLARLRKVLKTKPATESGPLHFLDGDAEFEYIGTLDPRPPAPPNF